MADWVTISSLATAGGTLTLAVATFASVRSANRSAALADLALQEQLRPVLVNSRFDDPTQKIMFADEHWVHVAGSQATAEVLNGNVYLTISLRNVGSGIGVLQGWYPWPDLECIRGENRDQRAEPEQFRTLLRDLKSQNPKPR